MKKKNVPHCIINSPEIWGTFAFWTGLYCCFTFVLSFLVNLIFSYKPHPRGRLAYIIHIKSKKKKKKIRNSCPVALTVVLRYNQGVLNVRPVLHIKNQRRLLLNDQCYDSQWMQSPSRKLWLRRSIRGEGIFIYVKSNVY